MNKVLQAERRVNAEQYGYISEPGPAPVKQHRPSSRAAAKKGTILMMALACFSLGIVIITQYSSTVSLHYRLNSAENRLNQLTEEYRTLEMEAAQLSALSRIELVARTELGMCEPESGQLRVLTASQEDGVRAGE